MKAIITIIGFMSILSFELQAGCFDDFRALKDTKKVSLTEAKVSYIEDRKEWEKLTVPQLKAFKNYISYLKIKKDEYPLKLTVQEYRDKKTGILMGHKIAFMAGDESRVSYYMKNDESNTILYRYWANQSPVTSFICK